MSQRTKLVNQKKWIKGVVAASQTFAQPPGSFPRDSNVQYIRRGSLYTCDGTSLISLVNGAIQPSTADFGPLTEIFLYQPIGGAATYYAIQKDYNTNIAAPASLAAAAGAAGALTGAYKYVITALDGAGGETTASNEASVSLTAQKGSLTWTAVTNAAGGYNIYRTVAGGGAGTEHFVATVAGQATAAYIDNTPDGSLGPSTPPAANTTQVCEFYKIPGASYSAANIVKQFPADNLPFNPGGGGGWGGGGGGPSGGGGTNTNTPAGGVQGNISPLPLIVQFNNLMILLLGNGFPPYSSDGTTPNTIALVNNFQASYGTRTASTIQNVGDEITATVSAVAYIFTCVQAGTTGAGGAPAFSATLGSIVVDGTVYWKNTGSVAAATAPRGAAHGIVYAGSLWVGNTSPTTTSDNFDGPSCLKMSDLNNPNSWNPLNVAFLDRDDGTQITGMATYTLAESGIPPTGSLVVFKDFSTFQVNGVFGAADFSIQRAQTDLGCVAGRTAQFVPGFGIVRLTHMGIAVFDGVRDRLLSEGIRPYIFGGQSDISAVDWSYVYFSKAAQTTQPPMYCCAVPLLPNNAAYTGPSFVVSRVTTATTLPAGNYRIKVQGIFGNGSTVLGVAEFGPIAVDSTHGIQVVLPAPPANLYKWRVFYGIGAGGENQYQDFAPVAATVNITAPGIAGFTSSLNGQLNRLLCYDLVLRAWTVVDLPFPIASFHQFRLSGSLPITVMTGFNDGGIRRWLGGAALDLTWDVGATNAGAPDQLIRASVRTPEIFGQNAGDHIYFRGITIRGVGAPSTLQVTAVINGNGQSQQFTENFTTLPMANNEFAAYLDINVTGSDAYAVLNWTGQLEIQSIDWEVVPKAQAAKVAI